MLKKELRLNLKTEFKKVASGKRFETAHFILFFLNDSKNLSPKVGVAVAKKNFRKAHERNKVKRKSFLAIKPLMDRLNNGTNLVIMPKSGVYTPTIKELTNELANLHSLYTAN